MLEVIVGLIGTAVFGVIGWAFHLTSRVAVLEASAIGVEKLLQVQLEDIKARLARIEVMLDRTDVK